MRLLELPAPLKGFMETKGYTGFLRQLRPENLKNTVSLVKDFYNMWWLLKEPLV